ncbi:MAG: hypothetical protein V1764_04285 [Nitrospirota bacterium]
MKSDENDIDLIERFLDGTLNESELTDFYQRVEKDPDFARLVEFRKKLPDLWIKADHYQEIRADVRRSIKMPSHQRIFHLHPAVFAIAASVVILIGIAVALILGTGGGNKSNEDNQAIIKQGDSILPLKTDRPDAKARLDTLTEDSVATLRLLFPPDGGRFKYIDTITFPWIIAP